VLIALLLVACAPEPEEASPPTAPADTPPVTEPVTHPDPTLPILTLPTADTGASTGRATGDTGTPLTGSTGDTAEPEPGPQPGDELFADEATKRFVLGLDDTARDILRATPDVWVPASLTVGSDSFALVGVRLKGNGSFQPFDDKPSWKVDLDHYVEGQEIDGLDDLVLDNMSLDATWMRAHLANELYSELGVPAPRSSWVTVVEGDREMVVLLSEDKDGRFLNRWYEDGDGPLYELFDVDITTDQVPYLDHDGGPADLSAFFELAALLDQPDMRLSADAGHVLDVEQFAHYLAISSVVGQFDAYPYSVPGDDVYLYVDPTDGRIDILPHGVDETFTDRYRPVDFTVGRLGTACIADPVCEQWWAEGLWATLDHVQAEVLPRLRADHARLVDAYGVEDCTAGIDSVQAEYDLSGAVSDAALLAIQDGLSPTCSTVAHVAAFVIDRRTQLEGMPGVPPP